MSNEFVTILSSWSVEEAHLARIRLIAEGINAKLADELTVGMNWSLANAMKGVKLFVPEAEADRARSILSAEPISNTSDPQAISDAGLIDVENQLTMADFEVDSSPGTLTAFRSIKEPVICLLLAPMALRMLILISGGLIEFVLWLK